MKKAEIAKLERLSKKQGFETLSKSEAKELARLAAKQTAELHGAKKRSPRKRS